MRTYPEQKKTHLLPIRPDPKKDDDKSTESPDENEDNSKRPALESNLIPDDQPVKSVSDLTVTVVPIVSVCAIFLMVGIIALVFRKKICLGRTKNNKDDMVRKSCYRNERMRL